MLTDKSGGGVPLYLHSGWTDCDRKYVWTGEGQKKEQIVQLLSQMDQRDLLCAGWMSVLAVCVCVSI